MAIYNISCQHTDMVHEVFCYFLELEEQACSHCPAVTYQQRIIGSSSCLILGFLISLGSTVRIVELLKGNPEPFAIMYTLGNVLGVCSTCFIYGPWSQAKKMFAPTRLMQEPASWISFHEFFMQITCHWSLSLIHVSHSVLGLLSR